MSHFTYLTPFIEDENLQKVAMAAILGGGLYLAGRRCTRRLAVPEGVEQELVPAEKFNGFGFFDFFVELLC